jgi:hypothetical protein
LPATQPLVGTESTHKQYVDTAIAAKALYQGVWQVAANIPDLVAMVPLHSYSWIANTVDPNIPETADIMLPGIGGTLISSSDTIIWNATTSLYEHVRSPASVSGDFVEVTGDTMTGNLLLPAAMPTLAEQAAHKAYVDSMATTGDFVPLAGGTMTGNLGMATGTRIDLLNSAYIEKVAANNGLFFHTPGGGVSNFHVSGTGNMLTIASGGVTAYGGLTVNGALTVNDTLALSSATLTCPEGSKIQFNNTACFIASTSNTRIRYDSGDQHNFFVGVSKFLAVSVNGVEIWGTFTDSLANMPGVRTADDGINVLKALSVMADQIVALRAEVATLKGTPQRDTTVIVNPQPPRRR